MKRNHTVIIIMIAVLSSLLLCVVLSSTKLEPVSPKDGELDLSEWKDKKQSVIKLSGEWEFYWNKILYSDDFNDTNKPDLYVDIPSVWNSYKLSGKKLPGFGYATFRLRIKNADIGSTMALRMYPLSTSYKLYVDHTMLKQSGIVGTSKASSKAGYSIDILEFTPEKKNFDIIIQVSNYFYARGGMWFEPQLGSVEKITHINQSMIFRDIFFLGCIMVMLLFSMISCFLKMSEKVNLYFSIICFSIISRIIFNGFSFIQIFPVISKAELNALVDYISVSWFAAAFIMLIQVQVLKRNVDRYKPFIWSFNYIYTLSILLTPLSVFTRYKYVIQIFFTVILAFCIIELLKAVLHSKKNSFLLLFGFALFFVFGLFELLTQDNYIAGSDVGYFTLGCFILLFFIFILITKNYMDTMKERELGFIKIKATKQKEYESELRFLKAQIKPHFVHNALNAIISISRYDPDRARNLLVEFSRYLRTCFDFENHDNMVTVESEISFVQSYITIQKARFGDKLDVNYEIQESNILIPTLILQPLVENAILHGIRKNLDGGSVLIYIHKLENHICIGVKDNGPGIPEERINEILNGPRKSRGVGLYNINQRLNKLYQTSLKIEKNSTGGVNIYMNIPIGNT